MHRALSVLHGALRDHNRDGMPLHAAALAFYLLLATVPLFALVLLIVGAGAEQWLFSGTDAVLGDEHGKAVKELVAAGPEHAAGWGAVGVIALFLYAAYRVFSILETALNRIWDVKAEPERGWLRLLRKRLLSFGALTGFALLLVVSLAGGALLASLIPAWAAARVLLQALLAFGALTFIYKQAPDAHTRWKDVLPAAGAMAVLLAVGERVLGTAFARSIVLDVYGPLAAVIIAMLWFYFSSAVLLFGAELAQERAAARGDKAPPEAIASRRGDKPEGGEPLSLGQNS